LILIFTYFSGQILMKKFVTLGNECVKYLKATRASEGNLLSYTLLVFRAFFSLFELQMLWRQLMLAFLF
jgi:hypothetical protein